MKWYKTTPPKNEDFLACLNTAYNLPFYVLHYSTYKNCYEGAFGEDMEVDREDILAWTTMEELDNDCFGS